jgi:hypothetical protein
MSFMANLTLIYGLRLLPEGEVTEIKDATLKLATGHEAHVTMHLIEGSREEIEAQLKRSLDAHLPRNLSRPRQLSRAGSESARKRAPARSLAKV